MIGRLDTNVGIRVSEAAPIAAPVLVAEFGASLRDVCTPFSTLSRCNQGLVLQAPVAPKAVDRAQYNDTDARVRALNAGGIRGTSAAVAAQASDSGEAARRYNEYVQGQYVTADEAAVLTVATAGTPADIGTTLATYRTMRRYDDMTQATAALLTTTSDPIAAYQAFSNLRGRGIDRDSAALLAHATDIGVARDAYDALVATGMDSLGAALVASVGASAGATAKTIVETTADLRTTPTLAAAALASNKTSDQISAASDYFGGPDADMTAIAWAVRDGRAMACIATAAAMMKPTTRS